MFRDRTHAVSRSTLRAQQPKWLSTSLSHIGRARDAIAVAQTRREPRDPDKNGKNDGGIRQRSGRLRWVEVLTRYELWET